MFISRVIMSYYAFMMSHLLLGDGNGKSSHISLFFVVMKGMYDGTLKWPFGNKVR